MRLERDSGLQAESVFVGKGECVEHERGLNVLTEPGLAAGTGTAYNDAMSLTPTHAARTRATGEPAAR